VALVLGAFAVAVCVGLGLGASRRRTLTRRVGSFDCGLVRTSVRGAAVSPGKCQYGSANLYWWRSWSLAPRPARTWVRSQIEVVERTLLDDVRATGRVSVRCRTQDGSFELRMSREAYAGLRSWLEAAPPVLHRVV